MLCFLEISNVLSMKKFNRHIFLIFKFIHVPYGTSTYQIKMLKKLLKM